MWYTVSLEFVENVSLEFVVYCVPTVCGILCP